jgi:hypothetical protein
LHQSFVHHSLIYEFEEATLHRLIFAFGALFNEVQILRQLFSIIL